MYAVLAAPVGGVVAFVGLGVLLARAPGDLARNALVQKTFGAGPLILSSVRRRDPVTPRLLIAADHAVSGRSSSAQAFCGPRLHRPGLADRPEPDGALDDSPAAESVGARLDLVAALVWIPAMVTPGPRYGVAAIKVTRGWRSPPGAAGGDRHRRAVTCATRRRLAGGLALLGLVVFAVLAERLVIAVTPKVSSAALTFRSLMPIVPLFALVGGGGLWSGAGALALLMPSARWARPILALLISVVLVTFWSPLLRERLSSHPLLGRVADRGADPDTAEGLRVEDAGRRLSPGSRRTCSPTTSS